MTSHPATPTTGPAPFPAAALADLPVFPLADVTLFPGAMMPLHIFEGRYRAMIRHALGTHRCLAMARLLEPARQLADDVPFDPIAGLGVIVQAVELPDGRFHLLVQGKARVTLRELPFAAPFRRAEATVRVGDPTIDAADLTALDTLARGFGTMLMRLNPTFRLELPPLEIGGDEEGYVDSLASAFVVDPDVRQAILAETQLSRRAALLLRTLAEQHLDFEGTRDPSTLN